MIYYAQFGDTGLYDIRIWQCTDFSRHWHNKTEIYICLQGQMKINIEEKIYCLNQNDTVFVSGNEAHEIFCDDADTRVILIAFGYELLGNDYNNIQNSTMDIPFFNLKDRNISSSIRQPLIQIREVLCEPDEHKMIADWKFRSSIYKIASYIFEHSSKNTVSTERLLRAKHFEKMYSTLQYIYKNFSENITVEQAASEAGYDRSYFCKQFRNATGMTFHRYLNYYRISEACRLLSNSKLPLSEVAEQSGFASQKNLSRLFRDIIGITPTQYQRLPLEEKKHLKSLNNIFD